MKQTAAYSFPGGQQYAQFPVVDFDDESGWDGVSAYTIPRGGLWHFQAGLGWVAPPSSGTPNIGLAVNGVVGPFTRQGASSSATGITLSALLELDTGDVVQVNGLRLPTTAVNTFPSACWFSGFRCGPVRWT